MVSIRGRFKRRDSRMVAEEEIAELIKNYFPNCPICSSDSGYNISGSSKNYFQCNSCRAKWMSYDLIKRKVTDIALKKMMLWETPIDGRGKSLLRKEHTIEFWRNLLPEDLKVKESKPKPRAELIFSPEMSHQELQASIMKSMEEITRWDYGSTLEGKLGLLFGDSTSAEATMIRLLRAIFEQNKVLIMQNELIRRALTKSKNSKSG